ncbi:MAG TPA: hypothetical protein VNO70_04650 [Blastocatellia bacterium]|nr:hypothetical protein [Blastocatellia bacterium]
MVTQIEVQQETAERLAAQAQARGLSVDVYLRTLLDSALATSEPRTVMTPQEKARRWQEWVNSLRTDTPILSDEAISRESIYDDER